MRKVRHFLPFKIPLNFPVALEKDNLWETVLQLFFCGLVRSTLEIDVPEPLPGFTGYMTELEIVHPFPA